MTDVRGLSRKSFFERAAQLLDRPFLDSDTPLESLDSLERLMLVTAIEDWAGSVVSDPGLRLSTIDDCYELYARLMATPRS